MEQINFPKEGQNKFYDLIYAPHEVEEIIKKKYPNAKIKDASDYIHTERFECEIEGITKDDFYPFAIANGFVECCLAFQIEMTSLKFKEFKQGEHEEILNRIDNWIKLSKEVIV